MGLLDIFDSPEERREKDTERRHKEVLDALEDISDRLPSSSDDSPVGKSEPISTGGKIGIIIGWVFLGWIPAFVIAVIITISFGYVERTADHGDSILGGITAGVWIGFTILLAFMLFVADEK